MFEKLKQAHQASMFDAKIGVAAQSANDPKISAWVAEAYAYFQKLLKSESLLNWCDAAECKKYIDELDMIYSGLLRQGADSIALASVKQMAEYFGERQKILNF